MQDIINVRCEQKWRIHVRTTEREGRKEGKGGREGRQREGEKDNVPYVFLL